MFWVVLELRDSGGVDIEIDIQVFASMEKLNVDPMDWVIGSKDELG